MSFTGCGSPEHEATTQKARRLGGVRLRMFPATRCRRGARLFTQAAFAKGCAPDAAPQPRSALFLARSDANRQRELPSHPLAEKSPKRRRRAENNLLLLLLFVTSRAPWIWP